MDVRLGLPPYKLGVHLLLSKGLPPLQPGFHFFLDKKTKQTCPPTGRKIKTSEVFFEIYERLFFPSAKAASLSCLLSARPTHKSLPRLLQKTSKVIFNHARINEPWPTKNAGDALAGVLGSIFLGRLFVSFLVSKMKIGYRACPTTGGLISLRDPETKGITQFSRKQQY